LVGSCALIYLNDLCITITILFYRCCFAGRFKPFQLGKHCKCFGYMRPRYPFGMAITQTRTRLGGFITLTDEDGERNFIPVSNISCIEATRKLIYSDEVWEELKRNEDMDNRKN
jgi:hypothetical protein